LRRVNRHFFIVGAQRCGTTYLFTILDEHPEIEMARPALPEPKYFLNRDFQACNPEDYESRFFGRKPKAARLGEKGTSYMEHEIAGRRISSWYPDTRLIFLLRNPATRAISNYRFSVRNGLESLPMDRAFAEEDQRRDAYDHDKLSASPYAYLNRGHYVDYLQGYEGIFSRGQLIPLIYEEFVGRLPAVQALYESLGVDGSFVPPSLHLKVNAGDEASEPVSPRLRGFLDDHFADSIARLEAYLGRHIAAWTR
jgi:hypothetical protein